MITGDKKKKVSFLIKPTLEYTAYIHRYNGPVLSPLKLGKFFHQVIGSIAQLQSSSTGADA